MAEPTRAFEGVDGLVIDLRAPCTCTGTKGVIKVRGGQNCVYCLLCGHYAGYNAPKHETGERPRSVSDYDVSPKERARVLERARGRCELCGVDLAAVSVWHVEHLLPREIALKEELPVKIVNSEKNLAAFCEECNLGYKDLIDPILWLVIMRRRLTL